MAVQGLSIGGRLVAGETLKAYVSGSASSLQWQALINGNWVNVGTANSSTYVIPAGSTGIAYRLVADGSVYSTATGAVFAETKKATAPVLSGPDWGTLSTEQAAGGPVFAHIAFSDVEAANYGGGSLLVMNTNSLAAGGDGQDVLGLRFTGTGLNQFSYNAATREVLYTFNTRNGPVAVGTIDATLNGSGRDFKVTFNNNATKAVVDLLIDQVTFANNDDSPTASRLLTLRITDPTGASAQRVLPLSIEGLNDAPFVSGPLAFTVDENQLAVGTVAAGDPDNEGSTAQGLTFSLVAGTGGQDNALFTVDGATGALRFVRAPDFEGAHGAAYSVRVRVTDAAGASAEQILSVSVRNVNEAPVAYDGLAWGSESGSAAGSLVFSDPDAGDTLSVTLDTSATLGTVVRTGNTFTWSPAGAFEHLSAYSFGADSFSYTVTDAAGLSVTRTVEVRVSGENDEATALEGDLSGTLSEDTAPFGLAMVEGDLVVTDIDDGDDRVMPDSGSGSAGLGDFYVSTDGWFYMVSNSELQFLPGWMSVTEYYPVTTFDGTLTRMLAVTLQGRNDPASIAGTLAATLHEDDGDQQVVLGVVTVSDVDSGENQLALGTAVGSALPGTFHVGASDWSFSIDDAEIQYLGAGDTLVRTLALTSFDGTATQPVTVTIVGRNDAASISGDTWGVVAEDVGVVAGYAVVTGALAAVDVDTGEAGFMVQAGVPGASGLGRFFIDANGQWRYELDNSLAQALRTGELLTDAFQVSSIDGTATRTVEVTIAGADDAAAFLGTTTLFVAEDSFDAEGGLTVGANLGVSDADAGQQGVQPFTDYWSALGRFSVTAEGDWTWSSRASTWQIEALGAGETLTDLMGVSSLDGTLALLSVVITGQNDAPVSEWGETTGFVVEPGGFPPELPPPPTTATGTLVAWDKDNGDVLAWSGSAEGLYGSFGIDAVTGQWTYVVDPVRSDVLVMGQSAIDSFVATVSDGHGGSIQRTVDITVYGGNEVPVVDPSSTTTATVHETPVSDGTLVLDWAGGSESYFGLAQDAGGGLLLVGRQAYPFGQAMSRPTLARLNEDGSLDTTFGNGGSTDIYGAYNMSRVEATADGGAVVGGYGWSSYGNTLVDFALARFDADGQLDTGFGTGGIVEIDIAGGYDYLRDVFVLPDGKLLATGDGVAVRLNADGSLDPAFGTGGKWFLPQGADMGYKTVTLDAEGRMLVWSNESDPDTGMAEVHVTRYLDSDVVDTSFGAAGTVEVPLYGGSAHGAMLVVGADGSLVLATSVWSYVTHRDQVVLSRLDGTTGAVDFGFGEFGQVFTGLAFANDMVHVDAQGRITLTGQVILPGEPISTLQSGQATLRYLADGTLDTTFGEGGKAQIDLSAGDDYPITQIVGADGSVLVAGMTDPAGNATDLSFVKWTSAGQLDDSFGVAPAESVRGSIFATDPEAGPWYQPLLFTAMNEGTYGNFSLLGANWGEWIYTLDNSRAATQALEEGEQATDIITVAIRDDFGGTTYQDIVITVVGSYDPPSAP